MTDDEWRRRITEIHEASHGVVAWAEGQRLRMIVVRPGAGSHAAGFVHHEPTTDLPPLARDLIDLTILEAGRLAEDLVFPDPEQVRPTDEMGSKALTERLIQVLPDREREQVQYVLSDDAGDAETTDEARIASIVSRYASDEGIWLMALARARAVRLINEHRGAILRLAAELSRRPILLGRIAEEIIEAHERSSTA